MCNASVMRASLGYEFRVGQRRFFGFGQVRMLRLIWLHVGYLFSQSLSQTCVIDVKVFSYGDGAV